MESSSRDGITDLLIAWSAGDRGALTPLMESVYPRLLRIAGSHLKTERDDHTLDAAGLVNEAYLRLIQQERVQWQDRVHFLSVAARLMRRVLLDHARRRATIKRGPAALKVPLEAAAEVGDTRHPNLIALDDALHALESADPQLAEVVVMRYFGGMRQDEVAVVMGVSSATVARRWRTARAWLFEYLQDSEPTKNGAP